MIRRFGLGPVRGQKYRARPGVYAVLRLGGSLLVTFQQEPEPEYQLPGGGIDAGEQPLAALHREVLEETGWSIGTPRRLGAFRRFAYMPEYDKWAEKICAVYEARPLRQICAPREPGHSAVWLPLAEAARVLGNPGDMAFVMRSLRG